MASTSNQDVPLIDPSQLGKAVTANTAFNALDKAVSGILTINVNASGAGSPYTIPYASGDEPIAVKTALRFVCLQVTGSLSAGWTAYMPSGKQKFFFVQNQTTGGFPVTVQVSGQTGVAIAPGGAAICFLNGVDVVPLVAFPGQGFVRRELNTGGLSVATTDNMVVWAPTTPANVTFTLPASPILNEEHTFKYRAATGSFSMTIAANAGQTIDGTASFATSALYAAITVRCTGTNEWSII